MRRVYGGISLIEDAIEGGVHDLQRHTQFRWSLIITPSVLACLARQDG